MPFAGSTRYILCTFIEVGPGKTLSGLVKRTLSDVRVYSCETAEQVAAIADELA